MGKLAYCVGCYDLGMELVCRTGGVESYVCGCGWSVVFQRVCIAYRLQFARLLIRFCSPTLPPPPPASTHTIHAAIMRATQPSFGSIVLAGLILTGVRILGLLIIALRRFPAYLPL